jgi:hypothetical protein
VYLQNCKKLLLALLCPSVYPHGRTRLPLDGFWRNLIFELFLETVEKVQVSVKLDENMGMLLEDIFIFMIASG